MKRYLWALVFVPSIPAGMIWAQASASLKMVQRVQPVYPEAARSQGIQGVVSLHVLIGTDGAVQEMSVISGPPLLRQGALDAVHQWRYKPYLKDGKPRQVWTTVNVNFALTDGANPSTPVQVTAEQQVPSSQAGTAHSPGTNRSSDQSGGHVATPHAGGRSRPSTPNPVSVLSIIAALANGQSQQTLAAEAAERGVDQNFDDGDVEWLRMLGATDEFIYALRKAPFVFIDFDDDRARLRPEVARDESIARSVETQRPDDPVVHWSLGVVLLFQQKLTDAMLEFRKAIVLKPDLAWAHWGLANALLSSGDDQGALSEAREAVRLSPNAGETLSILGLALSQTGDVVGAIAELREAVRVAPDNDEYHYLLGGALFKQKNNDDAIHEIREAVRVNPSYGRYHYGLGQVLYEKQDFDGAAFEFKEAVRLHPGNATFHTWLAAALFSAEQFEKTAAEARTALMYDSKDANAKQFLASAKSKLSETAGAGAVNTQQPAGASQTASSSVLAGSTWACQLVETDQYGSGNWSLSATFLEDGTAKVMNTQYGVLFYDYPPKWQLNGSSITIHTSQEHNGDDFAGTMNSQTSMTLRVVGHPETGYTGVSGSLTCNRLTPVPSPQPEAAKTQSSTNHPPYDDKCLRTGQGSLGSVTVTNICTQPIDLKFCYRKQDDSGPWTCTVTPRLEPNHTLQSPLCEQCVFDGRAVAYLSSRNLVGSLPSDAEVASWTGSGPLPGQNSSASDGQGSSDGQRQWHFVNPAQNWDTLTFEIRGRNGDSNSDDWNDEATIRTITLKPGESWTEDCGGYFSLDIKWQLASASDPQVDTFYNSLVCYANNFVWNNNHNLREYDFPRQ
jgi:TonB family protein